jgi:hypothetical protein
MEANSTVQSDIKDLALKTETLDREKKAIHYVSIFQINTIETRMKKWMPLNMETMKVDTIKRTDGVYHNSEGMDAADTTMGKITATEEGKTILQEVLFQSKHRRKNQNQNSQTPTTTQREGCNNNRGMNNRQTGKWCANCRKPTHNTAHCWGNKRKT